MTDFLVLLTAAAAGLSLGRSLAIGIVLALTPLLLMSLVRPASLAVLGVGLTYIVTDLSGGAGGVQISSSDLLLFLAAVGWLCATASGQPLWARALRPAWRLLLFYAAVLAVATAAHLSVGGVVESLQRIQIVAVSLVVGAYVLKKTDLHRALGLFVVVTSIMAVVYALTFDGDVGFGNQKNPAGHFMALAMLVIVASNVLGRLRLALLVPLSIGLFTTGSRGAVLGLVVGLVVLPFLTYGERRRRTVVMIAGVAGCLLVAFSLLPADAKDRLSTFETTGPLTGTLSQGQYTIALREEYRRDALEVIASQPLFGVGVGNYLTGEADRGTLTDNPHNVFLLEAAEGGLPLGGAVTVLLLGSMAVLVRIRRETPLAALAGSVQAACIVHGVVDIYWVRGAPALGWLLVGAALVDAQRRRRG